MDLKQLEAFVSIATLQSFKSAANRLNLSQPATSLRLKSLEEELGAQLFERQGKRAQLTGTGLQLLPIAEQILESARALKTAAAGQTDFHQHVRIGATSTIANAWLCDLIEELLKTHSHLLIDVVVDSTPNLRGLLTSGSIDLAILMGPVHETGIRNSPLRSYENVWVAGVGMELPIGRLSIQDAVSRPIITYGKDSATYGSLEEALRQIGKWPAAVSTCASVGTMLKLISRNKHLGIMSEACLGDTRIRRVECDMKLPSYEYFVSYHMDSVGRAGMVIADLARTLC